MIYKGRKKPAEQDALKKQSIGITATRKTQLATTAITGSTVLAQNSVVHLPMALLSLLFKALDIFI